MLDYVNFDTSARIITTPDGHYCAVGNDIPMLLAGKGGTDDAAAHIDRAMAALGHYLITTRGVDGTAAYLSSRGIRDYTMRTKDGTAATGKRVAVAVNA